MTKKDGKILWHTILLVAFGTMVGLVLAMFYLWPLFRI